MGEDVAAAQRRNREQYAGVAANYATSESHAAGDDLGWFRARAASVVPALAVDVACGGGFSTVALAAAGHTVVATDLTPESVAAARAAHDRPSIRWVAGAAEALPFRHEVAGVVACRIAPHHFGDMAHFVDEAARVLRPGGMFLLVDTTVPDDDDLAGWLDTVERLRDPSHGTVKPLGWWRVVCAGARLDVAEATVVRKRHPLEPWLARSGCVGDVAADVRRRFREAPEAMRRAFAIEVEDDGTVTAYTDYKLCLRATKRG